MLVPFLFSSPMQLFLLAPRLFSLLFVLVVIFLCLNVPMPCLSSLPPAMQSSVLLVLGGAPTGIVFLTYSSTLSLTLFAESSFNGFPSSSS
jgi:hypothetical protein